MIRFLLRFFGLLALGAAFILVVYDGTRSIASNAVAITSVRGLWETIHASSLQNLRPAIEGLGGSFAWELFDKALLAPSWAVLAVLGMLFILFGRKKKPLIGYAR